ncbi:MAG: DUF2946 family protein [Orrella sp.]
MDKSVLDAIARWPDVPAVYGWLSLSARGLWRLHPDGKGMHGGAGEGIQNTQILTFMGRNYTCDEQGQWFFQNGPQRVFVRIDAAPLIVSVDDATGALNAHTGQSIGSVNAWYIDPAGGLFLDSDLGPGQIIDRDLMRLADHLFTQTGESLLQWWATSADSSATLVDPSNTFSACREPAPVHRLTETDSIADKLAFVANPLPPDKKAQVS